MSARGRESGRGKVALVVLLALVGPALRAPDAGALVSDDADPTWMTNGRVSAVLPVGNRIYIGGTFTDVRPPGGGTAVARRNVAAINALTGAVDPDWDPGANGDVTALATDGTRIFAGGTFTAIGGRANVRLAALDPVTGLSVAGWRADANARVYSLAAAGGRVYAGGSFTSIRDDTGQQGVSRLAALDAATGRMVLTWRPAADAYVRAVEMSADNRRVFVGGDFRRISGSAHNRIAAVDAQTGDVDEGFTADGEYLVFDLAVSDNAVFAAVGGPGGRVSAFRADTGDRFWRVNTRGDVQAVAVDDTSVYAGGHFTGNGEFAGVTRWRLAAVTTGGNLEQDFAPQMSGQIWALATAPGRLYAGGDFQRVNGRLQQGFAQFSDPGFDPGPDPDPGDDLIPPNTTIISGPTGEVDETSATFQFSATEPSTFECSLDASAFAACSSPETYDGLDEGPHTFSVRARDEAGNVDPEPATAAWSVVSGDPPPPPPGPAGTITTVAGTGTAGFSGDGGPAADARIRAPRTMAPTPGGGFVFVDTGNHRIRRVGSDGTITTIAGTGTAGYSGDGGPATLARLDTPHGITVDAAGNVYVADSPNHRVRRIDPAGTITSVAGTGLAAYNGDGGPATAAALRYPKGVEIGPDGLLYIADTVNHRVRRIGADGTITTVAGIGTSGFSGDGGPAVAARFFRPRNVAFATDGVMYVVDEGNHRVRRVDPAGIVTTLAGTGVAASTGDNGPAATASLDLPRDVGVDAAGNVFIVEEGGDRVRRVDTAGVITTFAGTGARGYNGDDRPADTALLRAPRGVAVTPAGQVLIADTGNNRLRLVT
jgi:hypothetical protein